MKRPLLGKRLSAGIIIHSNPRSDQRGSAFSFYNRCLLEEMKGVAAGVGGGAFVLLFCFAWLYWNFRHRKLFPAPSGVGIGGGGGVCVIIWHFAIKT